MKINEDHLILTCKNLFNDEECDTIIGYIDKNIKHREEWKR